MAARYWVGGAGNWSSTTKWSTSSGGASGASVPTGVDDAIFDANSGGKFTATVDTAQSVNSLTITPSATIGVLQIALTAQLTTNALTTTSTSGSNRIWFRSTTYGTSINLVVNGAVSISDCDFRGVYVFGSSAPINGTRLGNRGECQGITFSSSKTVYWNLAGAQNWSANGWAAASGGAPSTDYFPLPQDTAVFDNTGAVTGTITLDAAIGYVPTIDMSSRTTAMTLGISNNTTVYGSWKNGSGTSITGASSLTFSGGTTQTITSAGKAFLGGVSVDTYGGTVALADAFSQSTSLNFTVTNGTFDTQSYSMTAGGISSSNTNVRKINLGASTISLLSTFMLTFTTTTNLTLNAGTSTITCSLNTTGTANVNLGAVTLYNFVITNASANTLALTFASGATVFNSFSLIATSSSPTFHTFDFQSDLTINGTFTCSGASPTTRLFIRSSSLTATRTFTAASLSATNADFQNITIAGAGAGTAVTLCGNCGNNSGITFPVAKTVYWNLSGSQSWHSNGWASSSGGAPSVSNFPLAQDMAVFDNTGGGSSVSTTLTWNTSGIDASARTTALTLTSLAAAKYYGSITLGTGITASGLNIIFGQYSNVTLTTNGVTINQLQVQGFYPAKVTLGSACTILDLCAIGTGIFDTANYNITAFYFRNTTFTVGTNEVYMGSSTWTATGTGLVWDFQNNTSASVYCGTSNIVLSDNTTTARSVYLDQFQYNKLTIGGNTSTSATTIDCSSFAGVAIAELTSTKTVAHTVIIGTTYSSGLFVVGKWSITGTVGNVVTITGNNRAMYHTNNVPVAIDYLTATNFNVLGNQLYLGANSTSGGGNTAQVVLTAAPAARTLYWVGGTGNWNDTAHWSTTSGGASGAAIPTCLDDVVFNSASNATGYTATVNVLAQCNQLTVNGPAAGTLSVASSAQLCVNDNVVLQASGTVSWTGSNGLLLLGTNKSYTFTTNGVNLDTSSVVVRQYGYNNTITLGSALTIYQYSLWYGTFTTNNYAVSIPGTFGRFEYGSTIHTVNFGASTVTSASTYAISFAKLGTYNIGTSTIVYNGSSTVTLSTYVTTYYNMTFGGGTNAPIVILPTAYTFNNLTITNNSTSTLGDIKLSANITVNGTLTTSTVAPYQKIKIYSSTVGTRRTMTCAAVSISDTHFLSIVIAGAAAPAATTRGGDLGDNSGITFPTPKTVYWSSAATTNWTGTVWATTSGGVPAANNFPLPQDDVVFDNGGISSSYMDFPFFINSLDMSARTTALTLTAQAGTLYFGVGQNFKLSSSVTYSGSPIFGASAFYFYGTKAGTITSNGVTFPTSNQWALYIDKYLGGSVTLADALTLNTALSANAFFSASANTGTFDSASYNVTASFVQWIGGGTLTMGSGTWTVSLPSASGSDYFYVAPSATVNIGTANIVVTGATDGLIRLNGKGVNKITFAGASAGQITFASTGTVEEIASTRSVAYTIVGTAATPVYVTNWTASGSAGNLITINNGLWISKNNNSMAISYITATNGAKAYNLSGTWYVGTNSTNGGSLGFLFQAPPTTYLSTVLETASITDAVYAGLQYDALVAELASTTDQISAAATYGTVIIDSATGTDLLSAAATFGAVTVELATATDQISSLGVFGAATAETATAADLAFALMTLGATILESASASDTYAAGATFFANVLDAASGTEQISTSATLNPQVIEQATASDLFGGGLLYLVSVLETAGATDLISAAFLWNPIDDSQVANWTNVNDTQLAGWASLDDTQAPNWQNVNDSQTPGWDDINDGQAPNWQDINT